MAFVNERIPEADVEKYGLEAIDEQHLVGCTNSRDWTIDRARDIYPLSQRVLCWRCWLDHRPGARHLPARSSHRPGRAVPHLDLDLLLERGADLVQAGRHCF